MKKSDDLLKEYGLQWAREQAREDARRKKECSLCGAIKRDGSCPKCGEDKEKVTEGFRNRMLADKRFTGLLELFGISIDDVSLYRLGPGRISYFTAESERAMVNFRRAPNGHIVPYRIEICL